MQISAGFFWVASYKASDIVCRTPHRLLSPVNQNTRKKITRYSPFWFTHMKLRIFTDSASCWSNQTLKLCLLHKSISFSFHINDFIRWNFYLVIFILILVASLVNQLSSGLSSAFFPLKNGSNYLCLWEQWEQQCTKDKNILNYPQENYREATAAVSVPTNYPFTDLLLELLTWVNDTAERQSETHLAINPLKMSAELVCWAILFMLINC